ncbi:MAG: DUF1853 family protein [Flavobacteriales bacterium]|nr:DUF1853 family protein [Flavobacteriales bacterium]
MKTKSRIVSILNTKSLDQSITGLHAFDLSNLSLPTNLDFQFPSNVRLGHIAENIVSGLIKSSSNYNVLYENTQVIEEKNTIGEIDFIIEEVETKQVIHLELAYKFYLYDPSISSNKINNWIGPNRNDSLVEKLEKLKRKQFPLLYHTCARAEFSSIEISKVSQALCLLVTLFIPYKYKGSIDPIYDKYIKGYYINFEAFIDSDDSSKNYHIPSKKEWGIEPSENETWTDFNGVEEHIRVSIGEKQALLCWQKQEASYSAFFIVWDDYQ